MRSTLFLSTEIGSWPCSAYDNHRANHSLLYHQHRVSKYSRGSPASSTCFTNPASHHGGVTTGHPHTAKVRQQGKWNSYEWTLNFHLISQQAKCSGSQDELVSLLLHFPEVVSNNYIHLLPYAETTNQFNYRGCFPCQSIVPKASELHMGLCSFL